MSIAVAYIRILWGKKKSIVKDGRRKQRRGCRVGAESSIISFFAAWETRTCTLTWKLQNALASTVDILRRVKSIDRQGKMAYMATRAPERFDSSSTRVYADSFVQRTIQIRPFKARTPVFSFMEHKSFGRNLSRRVIQRIFFFYSFNSFSYSRFFGIFISCSNSPETGITIMFHDETISYASRNIPQTLQQALPFR